MKLLLRKIKVIYSFETITKCYQKIAIFFCFVKSNLNERKRLKMTKILKII